MLKIKATALYITHELSLKVRQFFEKKEFLKKESGKSPFREAGGRWLS